MASDKNSALFATNPADTSTGSKMEVLILGQSANVSQY